MNKNQKTIETCMNRKIEELKACMGNLTTRDNQPTDRGNLYNGMLKSSVEFEMRHMEHLKEELMAEFE